jgi:hypothetical protein
MPCRPPSATPPPQRVAVSFSFLLAVFFRAV